MENIPLGKFGEDRAADYLRSKKYHIIGRNVKLRGGEIDIIAELADEIIFVEIKTSVIGSEHFFLPEGRVGPMKSRRLRRLSELFLATSGLMPKNGWRIDVVGVIIDKSSKKVTINHIENAIKGN